MTEATDIDLVIEDEDKSAGTAEAGAADTTKKVIEPDEGIDALKERLAAAEKRAEGESAARRTSDAEARRLADEAARAQGAVVETQVELVENAITSLNGEQDRLTKDLEDAWSAGDMGAAAKIQRTISGNEAKLLTLSNGLQQMKEAPKPQARPAADSPVERVAAALSPKSAAWVRAHPEFVNADGVSDDVMSAHYSAKAKGYALDSDAYFAHIEQQLGVRRPVAEPDAEGALSEAAAPTQRRTAPPAAPVGRGGGPSQTRVTLSRDQVEAAEACGMTPQEYAKHLQELKSEGRIH